MQLGGGARSHVHTEGPPPLATPITYRHVLSAGSLSPANPLRVIAHCDVDAAYAAFEAKRLGIDPHAVPIAVQQWNGLLAISYAARKYGIIRHETIDDARKKCPELIFAHVATYAAGSDKAEYHENPRPETHKVSLDPYRRESKKILDIFKRTCPAGAVEKASIDESFFDLTIEVRKALLEEYPQLRAFPADSPAGMDTPLPDPPQDAHALWTKLGHLIPIEGDVGEGQELNTETKKARAERVAAALAERQRRTFLPKGSRTMAPNFDTSVSLQNIPGAGGAQEQGDGDQADVELQAPPSAQPGPANGAQTSPDAAAGEENVAPGAAELEVNEMLILEETAITWQDVALAVGAKLMNKVRAAVREELGYTTSAGIACNKTLAKLCSGWRKPNAQTIMRPAAVKNFLKVLPFQKIRFLGGKLGDAMANEWQSATVGDLWSVTLEQMQARFGEESGWVYNVLRGIDLSEVKERVSNKTMLASKNVRPVITTWAQGQHWLSILSTELAIRLAEARESEPNLWPRTMVLRYIRIGDSGRSRQAAFPLVRELNADVVRKAAEKLWRDAFGELARPGGEHVSSPSKGGAGDGSEGGESRELRPGIVTVALGFSGLEKSAESGQQRIDETFFMKGAQVQQQHQSSSTAAAGPSSRLKRASDGSSPFDAMPSSDSDRAEAVRSSSVEGDAAASSSAPARKKQKKLGPLEAMLQTQQQQHQQRGQGTAEKTEQQRSGAGASAGLSRDGRAPRVSRPPLPSWTCKQCGEVLRPPADLVGEPEGAATVTDASPTSAKAPWPFDDEDDIGGKGAARPDNSIKAELEPGITDSNPAGATHTAQVTLLDEEILQDWLTAARMAHEDEHLARQLQAEENRRDKMLAGSQAYAAARAAAAAAASSGSGSSSSTQGRAGKGGSGRGSTGPSAGGAAGKGKGKAKPKGGGGSGNIASFFSQSARRD